MGDGVCVCVPVPVPVRICVFSGFAVQPEGRGRDYPSAGKFRGYEGAGFLY